MQASFLYTDHNGMRRLRVITRQMRLATFYGTTHLDSSVDPLEKMNSEMVFMVIVRQLLLRYGESNLKYISEKLDEVIAKLLKLNREKSQKMVKLSTISVPDGMRYLPFFAYRFKNSILVSRVGNPRPCLVELERRELMRVTPTIFSLKICPLVYNLSFYLTHPDIPHDQFVLPPTMTPNLANIVNGSMLEFLSQ